MYISKQAFDIVGVTVEDYLQWCQDYNKLPYMKKVRKEFFGRIKDGRIVRDHDTRKLKNKIIRPRKEVPKNEEN